MGTRVVFARLAGVLMAALLAGCGSGSPEREHCPLRPGMTADELVRCGCTPAHSGGGTVMIGGRAGAPGRIISMVRYLCPQGRGRFGQVEVVDGVVQRVLL
jgi:hypothetical protein